MDDKYLIHIPKKDHLTGLLHQRENLFALLMEAKFLNRIAIIPPLYLNGKHNHGKDIKTSWEKYINLNNLQNFHSFVYEINNKHLFDLDTKIINEEMMPVLFIDDSTTVLIRKYKRYPNYYRLINIIGRLDWKSDLLQLFKPSENVIDYAKIAINQMNDYNCMHVRRGDKLTWKQCPGLNKATQPHNLKKILFKNIAKGETVYIMSNEPKKGFFNELKKDYSILTFRDFDEFIQLEKEDNYLLFMVENEIMNQSVIKIKTFVEQGYFSIMKYGPNGRDTLKSLIRYRLRRFLQKKN
jgi:hypothetical protein